MSRAVEAVEGAEDHLGGDALEHLILLRVRPDHAIEYGHARIARHVSNTHVQPSFLESSCIL
jgi:hypothetical protein